MNLKIILRLNAISCLVFGVVFIFFSEDTSLFIGKIPSFITVLIGIVLIVNAGHLFWATTRKIPKYELVYFITGDFLWVALTLAFVMFGVWITEPYGILASSLVALMVGLFGYLQLKQFRLIYT